MATVVGVADVAVSNKAGDTLITYSLGSCIAVITYDPVAKVGGILHYMLPEAAMDMEKAKKKPAMFADSGIPVLFKMSYQLGATKKSTVVKVAGGSQIMDENGVFNIGKRNYLAMRKIFWRNNVMVMAEEIGGNVNRTVRLEIATGRVIVKISGFGEVEL
jgi:chemotaxis protein CheD